MIHLDNIQPAPKFFLKCKMDRKLLTTSQSPDCRVLLHFKNALSKTMFSFAFLGVTFHHIKTLNGRVPGVNNLQQTTNTIVFP